MVLQQFPTEESRQSPEFVASLAKAQLSPVVDMNYTGMEVNVHVMVGLLDEVKATILRNKFEYEQAQVDMARMLRAVRDMNDGSRKAIRRVQL